MSRAERFTQRAKAIMTAAQEEAESAQNSSVETPHLLLGILKVQESLACRVLTDLRIEYDRVVPLVRAAHPAEPTPPKTPTLSADTRHILESSVAIARQRGDHHVGSEHLLLALVKGDDKPMRYLMRQINLEPQVVRSCIERALQQDGGDGAYGSDADPTATQTVRAMTPSQPEPNARARVLQMVENGRISAAEAAELLKAMRFAAVPMPGSGGFLLLPLDNVNFDNLRERTLRFTVTAKGTSAVKTEISVPFEQAQAEIFRLLNAIYGGNAGASVTLESAVEDLNISLE